MRGYRARLKELRSARVKWMLLEQKQQAQNVLLMLIGRGALQLEPVMIQRMCNGPKSTQVVACNRGKLQPPGTITKPGNHISMHWCELVAAFWPRRLATCRLVRRYHQKMTPLALR